MNDKLKYSLVALFVVVVLFFGLPALFATRWKSSTLSKVNTATDVINETNKMVAEFEVNPNVASSDFDAIIAAYKKERTAIKDAQDAAMSLGGFKGLDITGDYKKATETSEKLVQAYGQLLMTNEGEIASTEAEKQVVAAFEEASEADDASAILAQAKNLRKTNESYQTHLNTSDATAVEHKFLATLIRLADAFEATGQAMSTDDVAKIDAAGAQLDAAIAELDALDPEIAAQHALDLEKNRKVVGTLNAAAKELE